MRYSRRLLQDVSVTYDISLSPMRRQNSSDNLLNINSYTPIHMYLTVTKKQLLLLYDIVSIPTFEVDACTQVKSGTCGEVSNVP